jgi:hypothetical protein
VSWRWGDRVTHPAGPELGDMGQQAVVRREGKDRDWWDWHTVLSLTLGQE